MLGIREITGYIAHLLLVGYWLWVVFSAAPQLRRGSRDRRARMEVLLPPPPGSVLTGLVPGVIHFWATEWWHVVVAVLVAAGLGMLLTRAYRRRVALPKHRLTLTHRARTFERGRRLPDV